MSSFPETKYIINPKFEKKEIEFELYTPEENLDS